MVPLICIGLVKDDKTLRELNVMPGAKMMVVGSTLGDVITVQAPSPEELKEEPKAEGQQHPEIFLLSLHWLYIAKCATSCVECHTAF